MAVDSRVRDRLASTPAPIPYEKNEVTNMCQSKAEGGRRCACSGTYTPKVAATRKSNSDYRKALASAVRRKGLGNLAGRVGTASFTAMPELTKAAGLDPSEVSSAPLPGTVKRHSVGQADKELISELETAATETVASPAAAENADTADNTGETATDAEGGDGDNAGEGAEAAHDNIFQMNVEELTARRGKLNEEMERLDNRIASAEERGRFNTADMLNDKYAELADEASTIDSLIEMRENGQLIDTVPVSAASDGEDTDDTAQSDDTAQTADDAQSDDTAQSETAEEPATPEDGRTREEKVGAEKDADKDVLQAYDANNYDKHVGQAAEAISKFTGEENTDIQTMNEAADAIVELGKTGLTRGDAGADITAGDTKALLRAVKAEAAHVRRAEACADEADRIYSMLRHSERETDNARSEDVLAATMRILPDHNPMGRGKSISSTSAAELAQSMLDNTYSKNGYDRAQLFARYSPSDFEAEKKLVDGENYRTYHAGYAATERYSVDHTGNVDMYFNDKEFTSAESLFEATEEICHTPLTRRLEAISREEDSHTTATLAKVREAINSASQEDVDSLVNSAWATAQENLDYTATNYMEMSNDDEKHRFEVWHASVNEEIDRLADAARAGRRDNVVELLALAHMAGEAPVDDDPDTASSAAPAGVEPLFDL